jgi:hypothetical protein
MKITAMKSPFPDKSIAEFVEIKKETGRKLQSSRQRKCWTC